MTREEFCLEYNITEDQFYGKKVINHSLNLNSIGNSLTIPEGFNPFINGFLFLENIRIIPEGFNARISGNLYLSNVEYLPRGFRVQVIGDINLKRLKSKLLSDLLRYPGIRRELGFNLLKNI